MNQRNAIVMYRGDGKWGDFSVSNSFYVICERLKVPASKLTECTEQSNEKTEQLDSQCKVTASTQRKEYLQLILEVKRDYKRFQDQLFELIQDNGNNQKDCLVKQKNIIRKLESKADHMATEIEFNKEHNSQLISNLKTEFELKLKEQTQHLESNERACSAKIQSLKVNASTQRKVADDQLKQNELILKQIIQQLENRFNSKERECNGKFKNLKKENDLLERRLNRLEQKMSTNIVDNSNKID